MSIPSELQRYREPGNSEGNFVQKFLKPLLQRLGYYSVRDYHGTREFGKDLVFAEVDKFVDISYHGLQAKYEESISLTMSEDLALDAVQAFTNPFEHPSTHQSHRITTFVAVNAGSVSDAAKTHFFNRVGAHAGSCRILNGADLLALDRSASLNRGQLVAEVLGGIIGEVKFNRDLVNLIVRGLNRQPRQIAHLNRLSDAAVTSYLVRPLSGTAISLDVVLLYAQQVRMLNRCLDGLAVPVNLEPVVDGLVRTIRELAPQVSTHSDVLEDQAKAVIEQLRPIVAS